jgi:hypothetical protein
MLVGMLTACSIPSQNSSNSPLPGLQLPDRRGQLIIKYDSSGNEVWMQRYNQAEEDINLVIDLDNSGNAYITGSSSNVKYDSDGKQLYNNALPNSNTWVRAATLDSAGNIYVTGTDSTKSSKIITFKYNSNGQQVWAKSYQYPGSKFNMPSAITLDKSGNLIITGDFSSNVTESKLLILKYNSQGNLFWSTHYDQGGTFSQQVVDDNGNIYITVGSLKSGQFDYDYVTIKYDTNGKELWVARYDGPVNGYDFPHALKVDSKGNVFVTGESDGSENNREYATIEYNSDGQELWVARYGGLYRAEGIPAAMAIDSERNIYVTGWGANSKGDNYATIKYDSNGHQLWVAEYEGTGSGLNEASALFVDSKGNVYVTGQCTIDGQYVTYDTVKYDQNGNELWVAKYSKVYFIDRPNGLIIDAYGNVYVTGPVSYYSN